MPRYLTPAKIHLLVLIDIHISGEIATSAHLHALNFIATRVVAPSDHEAASMRARYNIFEGSEVATLAEPLSRWPTYVPGRSTYDIFLLRMWDLISVDTLFDLFQHLCELSSSSASGREGSGAIKISRSSPIGQFVRRSCVEYTRLRFADAESLWRAVCASRSSSHSTWAQKNPSKVLAATGNGSNTPQQLFSQKVELFPSPVSDEDVGYLLNFSIHKLQKLGTRVPQLFRKQLDGWVSRETDSPAKSLQYFMAFFEHWRAGQHSAAIQSLHQYFDYYLNSKPASDNMKLYYQYALLHLSVLHADFAKWTDSVEALEECITTARENQDPACLSFALSWMLYLRQAHHQGQNSWSDCSESLKRLACLGGNDERDEIAFLKARAREGKNWALLSSTLLEEARVELGAKGSATKTAEHIVQASYFNTLHDLRSLLPASTLCSAACFNRLNFASLALCAYESVSVVHIDHAPLNDHVKAACRLAHAHALSGRHRAATDVLGSANSLVKGILKLEQKVQMFQMLIRVRFELQRQVSLFLPSSCSCCLLIRICSANSEAAKSIFGVLQPSCASADPDVAFELILLEIEMLTMQHNYSSALRRVNAHVADLKTAGRGTADIDPSYAYKLCFV